MDLRKGVSPYTVRDKIGMYLLQNESVKYYHVSKKTKESPQGLYL